MKRLLWPLLFFLILATSFGLIGFDFGFERGVQSVMRSAEPGLNVVSTDVNIPDKKEFSMMLDFGDGAIKTWQHIDLTEMATPTVWDLTNKIVRENNIPIRFQEYGSLGVLVEAIGEKENQAVERAWQFWVNNQYATQGASQTILTNGDIVEWKYTKGQL